jgi:hypothetical protein
VSKRKPAGRVRGKVRSPTRQELYDEWRAKQAKLPQQEPPGPTTFTRDSGDGGAGEQAARELLRQAASVHAGKLVTSERRDPSSGVGIISGTYVPPPMQKRTRVPEARTLEIIRQCQLARMRGRELTSIALTHWPGKSPKIAMKRLGKLLSQHEDLYKR